MIFLTTDDTHAGCFKRIFTRSSLTTVGTVSGGTWQATTIGAAYGGTGQSSYSSGQLLIGNASGGLTKATLTAGANIGITNGNGAITIAASGLGTMATQDASNVAITGGTISGVTIDGGSY